jgi:AhpD family alkylhydroperoxidase
MKRSTLRRDVSERISIAIQQRLGCELCLGAHIAAAGATGVTAEEVESARTGQSSDPALAAILRFALQVLSSPSTITEDTIEHLRRSGTPTARSSTWSGSCR